MTNLPTLRHFFFKFSFFLVLKARNGESYRNIIELLNAADRQQKIQNLTKGDYSKYLFDSLKNGVFPSISYFYDFCLSTACDKYSKEVPDYYINEGNETAIGEFPWMVIRSS